MFQIEKSAKKKLYQDEPYDSTSSYSSLQKTRSNATTLERSHSPAQVHYKQEKAKKAPPKPQLNPEQLKQQLEQRISEDHKQHLQLKEQKTPEPTLKIETEVIQKTENRHQKFGVKVFPEERSQTSPRTAQSQNDNNINLEKNEQPERKLSLDEVDKPRVPPEVKKREKINKEPAKTEEFERNSLNGSGIRRDKDGIPQELPSHMFNAAVAARRNRKTEEIPIEDDLKSPKKKGKAPAPPPSEEKIPPSAAKRSFDSSFENSLDEICPVDEPERPKSSGSNKGKELEDDTKDDMILAKESTSSSKEYNSDSDVEGDNQSSVNTIELNASDITIHQVEDEELQNRKTASTGDLSKIQKGRKTSTGTLERAQSLDITDASIPTLSKKRKGGKLEDDKSSDEDLYGKALINKEPRLSLVLDGLNTFQRNRLKKSTEWGNLEDAILNHSGSDWTLDGVNGNDSDESFNLQDKKFDFGPKSPEFNALVNKINEIKKEADDLGQVKSEVDDFSKEIELEMEAKLKDLHRKKNNIWPTDIFSRTNGDDDGILSVEKPVEIDMPEAILNIPNTAMTTVQLVNEDASKQFSNLQDTFDHNAKEIKKTVKNDISSFYDSAQNAAKVLEHNNVEIKFDKPEPKVRTDISNETEIRRPSFERVKLPERIDVSTKTDKVNNIIEPTVDTMHKSFDKTADDVNKTVEDLRKTIDETVIKPAENTVERMNKTINDVTSKIPQTVEVSTKLSDTTYNIEPKLETVKINGPSKIEEVNYTVQLKNNNIEPVTIAEVKESIVPHTKTIDLSIKPNEPQKNAIEKVVEHSNEAIQKVNDTFDDVKKVIESTTEKVFDINLRKTSDSVAEQPKETPTVSIRHSISKEMVEPKVQPRPEPRVVKNIPAKPKVDFAKLSMQFLQGEIAHSAVDVPYVRPKLPETNDSDDIKVSKHSLVTTEPTTKPPEITNNNISHVQVTETNNKPSENTLNITVTKNVITKITTPENISVINNTATPPKVATETKYSSKTNFGATETDVNVKSPEHYEIKTGLDSVSNIEITTTKPEVTKSEADNRFEKMVSVSTPDIIKNITIAEAIHNLNNEVTIEGPSSLTLEINKPETFDKNEVVTNGTVTVTETKLKASSESPEKVEVTSRKFNVSQIPRTSNIPKMMSKSPDGKSNSMTYVTEIQVVTPNTETSADVKVVPAQANKSNNKNRNLDNEFESYVKNFETNLNKFETNFNDHVNDSGKSSNSSSRSSLDSPKIDVEKELQKIQEIAEEQLKKLPEMRFTTSSYEGNKTPEKRQSQIEMLRSNFEKSPPKSLKMDINATKSRIPIATTGKTPPMSPERRDSRNLELDGQKDIMEMMSRMQSPNSKPKTSSRNVTVTSIRNNSKIPSGLPTYRPPIPPRRTESVENDTVHISASNGGSESIRQWVFNQPDSVTNIVVENKTDK